MVNGIHALVYVNDAAKARAFFRDIMKWPSVDAGQGWLIFALPPAEIAAHPAGDGAESGRCDLYFMCDDVNATVAELAKKGVEIVRPVADRGWGLVTAIQIPGGSEMGLYQPKHPIAYKAGASKAKPATKPTSKKAKKATKPKSPPKRAKKKPARR